MKTVSISEFKATCLALIKDVKRTGDPIIISLRGEPIAQVVPTSQEERVRDWIGSAEDLAAKLLFTTAAKTII